MVVTRVLAGLALIAAAVSAIWVANSRHRSFRPYLVALLVAAPLGALAAGLATGGIRHVRSDEREDPAPVEDSTSGWFAVPPFRRYLALRDSAAAALAVFFLVGGVAFVDYFGRPGDKEGLAVLALLAWLALMARLAWGALKRTLVGRRLDDARLFIRPGYPVAGTTLHVRFEQPVRTDVFVGAVELTLVAERLTSRLAGGKQKIEKKVVARHPLHLRVDGRAWPAAPLQLEGAIEVSPDATEGGGFLSWWIEARTRLSGPDYVTRFPIGAPDDDEDEADEDQTSDDAAGR
jgi:hypothetical protein